MLFGLVPRFTALVAFSPSRLDTKVARSSTTEELWNQAFWLWTRF